MKVAELYQGYNGEFFEILSFSDNASIPTKLTISCKPDSS